MNDEEQEKEKRRRQAAGGAQIPSPKEGEVIRGLLTTENELRILSDFGVYRVLLPDDIDPEVTALNVPWAVQKELNRGTRDPVVAQTLGQAQSLL